MGMVGPLTSGSYGWLLPDIGTILLNPNALSGSIAAGGVGLAVLVVQLQMLPGTLQQWLRLFRAISGSTAS
jgi:hypothetical protein